MGRGSGGRGGGSRSDSFNVNYGFEIFTEDLSGNTRVDVEGNLTNNIGIFPGAIENFELRLVESEGFFQLDGDANIRENSVNIGEDESDNFPAGVPSEFPNDITLDLTARFIPAGQTISLPDGREPVFISGDPSLTIENAESNTTRASRIEYTLTSSELASVGIDEITLVLSDSNSTNNADLGSLDIERAVNDIDYIINENLLGNIGNIRVSGSSSIDPSRLISREGSTREPSDLGDGSEFNPIMPVAEDDFVTTQENAAIGIDVLDNDNVGIIESVGISTFGGSIVQNGDLLEYTPPIGFTGQDTFQYTIDNLGEQDTATVTVEVTATEPPTPVEPPLLDGDDVISGDNGNNTLLGGEGNNILYGFGGDDVLQTGSGADNLQGDNGNDFLDAGGGNDIITGGRGNDIIDGGDGNDTIDAGGQDDAVFGGSGDDLINGGNGNDTLNGGAGNDVLVGDGGSDVFVVNTLGGTDTIRDFNFSQDVIGLSDGITFDQITISQGNGAAIINFNGQAIGLISGGTPSQFDASKFIEV